MAVDAIKISIVVPVSLSIEVRFLGRMARFDLLPLTGNPRVSCGIEAARAERE